MLVLVRVLTLSVPYATSTVHLPDKPVTFDDTLVEIQFTPDSVVRPEKKYSPPLHYDT